MGLGMSSFVSSYRVIACNAPECTALVLAGEDDRAPASWVEFLIDDRTYHACPSCVRRYPSLLHTRRAIAEVVRG